MLMAQAILRHYRSQGQRVDCEKIMELVGHFIESEEESGSQFSLSSMLKYARWKFDISPGDWFNIGQISDVLKKIQDDVPIAGTENLKVLFFSQSVVFKSRIVERAGYKLCSCGNN